MSALNIFSLLVLLSQLLVTKADGSEHVPLKIIWNVMTQGKWGCEASYKIPINVRQYGMLENAKRGSDGWHGEVIDIFYLGLGLWPYIHDGKSYNGGIPQLGDLQAHLDHVKDYINQKVDPEFSGLGVLDFEEWFAIWDMNFWSSKGEYRRASIDLAAQKHPGLTQAEIEGIAKEDFDRAARAYFEETLLLVKQLRPRAKWGYYIYPKCHNKKWDEPCPSWSYNLVKQMPWLAEASDALYPSSYFYEGQAIERRAGLINGAVNISRAWLDQVGQPHKPIYIYTSVTNNFGKSPMPYYTDFDLVASLGTAADLGVDGLIIWGNNYRRSPQSQCEREKVYLETKLGPYVQKLLDFFQKCSRDLCSSNGRCVKNHVDVNSAKINSNLDKDHVYSLEHVKGLYHCRCYEGWTAQDCSKTA